MYRKIFDFLIQWKKDKYRKPLIIQGARQVGKTYAVLEFGKESKVVVYKYKAKKNVRKKQGHRQPYTKVVIKKIK